jgi:hypothetical protein
LLGQRLAHNRGIVVLSHEPVSIPFQIFKGTDRFSEFRLREAMSLLAVSDIIENSISLNEKKLFVPQFKIEAITDPVVYQGREPGHPVQIAFSKAAILPLALPFGGRRASIGHRLKIWLLRFVPREAFPIANW